MSAPIDPEVRKKRIQTIVGIVGFLGICFVIEPFIFIAFKGAVAIILGLGVGYGIFFSLPLLGRMAANWRLKAIKAEAARNPVEALQNDYILQCNRLEKFATNIAEIQTARDTYSDQLDDFKQQFPENAVKYQKQMDGFENLLTSKKRMFKRAQGELELYKSKVDEAAAEWKMAQATAAATRTMGMSSDDFLQKIYTDAAFAAVKDGVNRAFADMDMQNLKDSEILPPGSVSVKPQAALSEGSDEPIDAEVIREKQPVLRKGR